ncbi:MAG TPA: YdcF family protein [Steroidobacteraceae bacterium]|nr:YdcF family protein [Steroidobacteraceae bacterium]
MLVTLKSMLHTLLLPPGGLLLLAIAGLLLLRRHRATGMTLLIAAIGALWLLSTPIIANELTLVAQKFPALDLSKPVDAQAIVILGGGGYRNSAAEYGGAPAAQMEQLDRLSYGAYVARKTSLPVLVTGTTDEAIAMSTSLTRSFGVTPRWVENHSRDTFDNARYSASMLFPEHITRIVLVTTSTHLWRATQEFRSAGFEVVPAPSDELTSAAGDFLFVPRSEALLRSQHAVYELLGEGVRVILAALHIRRQVPARMCDKSQSPCTWPASR